MPIGGDRYPFTKENVDKAPANHGVYALYVGNETTYIGRADGIGVTIRSRLQAHQRGDEGTCTQQATHYRREIREDAAAREAFLLQEYFTANGRLPRCNDRLPSRR